MTVIYSKRDQFSNVLISIKYINSDLGMQSIHLKIEVVLSVIMTAWNLLLKKGLKRGSKETLSNGC